MTDQMTDEEFEGKALAQEYGMTKEPRDIQVITVEIRTLHRQAQQLMLGYAIEIGRRLEEAKAQLPYGRWGEWLKNEVEFSQSTANNFMRIFDEYGADQLGLFGPEANSQTLGNLPYTKALRLLAVPAEEREEFAKENDVEHLSSRELDKLLRERDEARREKEEAQKETADLREKLDAMQGELADSVESAKAGSAEEVMQLHKKLAAVQKEAATSQKRYVDAVDEKRKAEEKLQKAKDAEKAAKEKLRKLRDEPPVVSPEILDEMKKKAEQEAAAAASKQLEQQLAQAEQRVKEAEERAGRTETEAAEARKKLELAAPDVAQFQIYFTAWQEQFNKMSGLLMKMPPETAGKLKAAAGSVLKQMQGRV